MGDKSHFDIFDSDGDGCISTKEIAYALYAYGCNPTVKEAEALAAQANPSDPEHITWQQFQGILAHAPRPDRSAEQHMLEAFRVFDKNEDGKIPENDIRVIFTTLGEQVDVFDLNELLKQVQVDQNGKVAYAEFVKLILKQ